METKSPAVLFYTSDFLSGVSNLTMEERGQYITLLCLQHQLGHLSLKTIKLNVNNVTDDVIAKFILDENGNYYQHRMEEETQKRNAYVDSRYANGYKGGRPAKDKKNHKVNHMVNDMDNHIGNENINININIYKNIIDYLNNKTNRNYNYRSKKNIEVIKARLNEGYTFEDFKKVIDIKTTKWLNNEWNIYLRPETLFSNKFDGYLNEKVEDDKQPNCFKEVKKEEIELTDEQRRELEEIEAKIRG